MRRSILALAAAFVAVAVLSFGAGTWLSRRDDPAPVEGQERARSGDLGASRHATTSEGPIVALDAGTVQLLPDAGLRVDWGELSAPVPRPRGSSPPR